MIAQVRQLHGHRGAILNMLVLFVGKTAGLLVGLLFLPMYHSLLGVDQFGVVAVVLSLQALLTMMDLGMSTMVSRDAALSSSLAGTYRLLLMAEGSLSGFYMCLAAAALLAVSVGMFGNIGYLAVGACVVLFWSLVLQNLYFSALLAKRSYMVASSTQIVGALLRAFASAYVLVFISATLEAFLLTQAAFGIAHAVLSRYFCKKALHVNGMAIEGRPSIRECAALARQGTSLIVFSAAGAAVTQLDKPLVSALVSAAELAPYFLATTVCMVPISVLAGPVSQFCQPRVLAAIDAQNGKVLAAVRQYVGLILLATCVPALLLWLGRRPLMVLWLGHEDTADAVAAYVAVLLPGFAIGALGFVPYTLLISAKDYRFQALSSVVLTVITLGGAALAASYESVPAVCWIYAVYHASSTVISWVRASMLPTVGMAAKYSLGVAVKAVALTALCGGIANQLIQ